MGLLVRFLLSIAGLGKNVAAADAKAAQIVAEAEDHKRELLVEAKEEALQIRSGAENESRERRREFQRQENRLNSREESQERRQEGLENREDALQSREKDLEGARAQVDELQRQELEKLQDVAGISVNDARDQIMSRAEAEMKHELAKRFYDMEQQMKEEADQKARKVITLAVHRLAADVVAETTTSVVPLPSDDMKGRLIGREGRNIRAIENATGVDLIVDDTPEAVTISCFDPVRREIARLALTKLIVDGRIHPARVEDTVQKAKKEVDEVIWKEGERAVFETGVRGLTPDVTKLLGRLKYRYSYGENILQHSIEVSLVAGMLAAEVGASIEVAKAGGLLHDIGKALTHEVEGPHAEIGADIAKRYGIPLAVQKAIMEHHDEEMGSVEAFLVSSADAISAARPGARRETLEHYIRRLEALENVAGNFPGVEKCFAIQAGREVRVMVKPGSVDDVEAANMARNVAKKIEESLVYPGQIKVMIIRETRVVEYAK